MALLQRNCKEGMKMKMKERIWVLFNFILRILRHPIKTLRMVKKKRAKIILNHIWGILRHPVKTYNIVKKEELELSFWYFFTILIILSVIVFIGSIIFISKFITPLLGDFQWLGWIILPFMVLFTIILGFIILVFEGLIIHFFIWLLGGKQGLGQTYKICVYAITPLVLSLWFPPLIVVTMIWSFILIIIGIHILQKLSIYRAIAATLIPFALIAVISLGVMILF
jgi:hypothetical protein